MKVPIRPFRPEDAPQLAQIFYSAVHEIAGRYYSKEQIDAWAPTIPDAERFRARGTDGRTLLIATDDLDDPVAFGDLEADGHIDHLFCRPDKTGQGVAAALLDQLEAAAKRQGMSLLYVEASEPARRFFLKHGFAEIARRDFKLGGVPIHNFRMEKRLTVPC